MQCSQNDINKSNSYRETSVDLRSQHLHHHSYCITLSLSSTVSCRMNPPLLTLLQWFFLTLFSPFTPAPQLHIRLRDSPMWSGFSQSCVDYLGVAQGRSLSLHENTWMDGWIEIYRGISIIKHIRHYSAVISLTKNIRVIFPSGLKLYNTIQKSTFWLVTSNHWFCPSNNPVTRDIYSKVNQLLVIYHQWIFDIFT